MNLPGPRIEKIFVIQQPTCTNVFTQVRMGELILAYQGGKDHAWGFAAGLAYLIGLRVEYGSCEAGDAAGMSWGSLYYTINPEVPA